MAVLINQKNKMIQEIEEMRKKCATKAAQLCNEEISKWKMPTTEYT